MVLLVILLVTLLLSSHLLLLPMLSNYIAIIVLSPAESEMKMKNQTMLNLTYGESSRTTIAKITAAQRCC